VVAGAGDTSTLLMPKSNSFELEFSKIHFYMQFTMLSKKKPFPSFGNGLGVNY
jgi:hypothetical protein